MTPLCYTAIYNISFACLLIGIEQKNVYGVGLFFRGVLLPEQQTFYECIRLAIHILVWHDFFFLQGVSLLNTDHPDDLSAFIADEIAMAGRRYTPGELERQIASLKGVPVRTARMVIREMIRENRLAYTQQLGHTFIETSYRQAVDVGEKIVLTPPDIDCDPPPGGIRIRIAAGAAFGMGDHPTTRISLRLAAWTLREYFSFSDSGATRAIDIGCGSGVLAIGACLLGIDEAVAIDIDACARTEAVKNTRLNNLENRIRISGEDAGTVSGPFHLVLANLRYPTLASLCTTIRTFAAPGAALIFSGFRENELQGILEAYPPESFAFLKSLSENGWCGAALQYG